MALLDFKSSGGCKSPRRVRFPYTSAKVKRSPQMIGGIGMPELLVILFIALLIFGARRLPEIGSGIGKAIRDFKRSLKEPPEIDVTPKEEKELEKKEEPGERGG